MKFTSIIAALLLAAAGASGQAATVRLDTVGSLQVGQSFDLQLRLDDPFAGLGANETLLSFGFHLDFDSSLLKLVSFTPAGGWDDDSAHLGANLYSASSFPGFGNQQQASLTLATLHFDVLQAGTSSIQLSTDLGDFNQGLGYLFAEPKAFDVSLPLTLTTVPEPGVLMLVGLAALAGWAVSGAAAGRGRARPPCLAH